MSLKYSGMFKLITLILFIILFMFRPILRDMDKSMKLRDALIIDIDKMKQKIHEYSHAAEKKKRMMLKLSPSKKQSNTDSSESFSM